MADDDSKDRAASRKELARRLRREAYQRAKEERARDPRFIAMKEAARQRRREAYQHFKAERKAAASEQKGQREKARAEERALADQELLKLMRFATKGSDAKN